MNKRGTNEQAMNDETLDRFLSVAGSLDWPGPAHNPRFEEFLMQQSKVDQARHSRRAKLILMFGAVLAGGTAFGAVRLYESYRVRVNINGVTREHDVTPGPDGKATIVERLDGVGEIAVQVGPENVGRDGKIDVNIVEGKPLPEGALEVEGVPIEVDETTAPDQDRAR